MHSKISVHNSLSAKCNFILVNFSLSPCLSSSCSLSLPLLSQFSPLHRAIFVRIFRPPRRETACTIIGESKCKWLGTAVTYRSASGMSWLVRNQRESLKKLMVEARVLTSHSFSVQTPMYAILTTLDSL